jgi:hypothetical protein
MLHPQRGSGPERDRTGTVFDLSSPTRLVGPTGTHPMTSWTGLLDAPAQSRSIELLVPVLLSERLHTREM